MTRRILGLAAVAVMFLTGSVLGQERPAHITVSKDPADFANFDRVQLAVNAASPLQIIEILDDAVYNEQVTIDSTKFGITIRSAARWRNSVNKPTIMWLDTVHQRPRNYNDVTNGFAGEFETCGALRIIRAENVTIDGIAVDGGRPEPFGWEAVWNNKDPLFHGNAAITLVIASSAVIRNCDLRNAYFGINVKDRNVGGVFGNPNPGDQDTRDIIPISSFGKVGGHLIEHNRIRDNAVGLFFESAWDLGSTVRNNLIYNNFHTPAVQTKVNGLPGGAGDAPAGGVLFKDMLYTPLAIYNNTFYNNTGNFFAHWKVAYPHLIFNNIYGKPRFEPVNSSGKPNYLNSLSIDHKYPHRMHNSLFSVLERYQLQESNVDDCKGLVPECMAQCEAEEAACLAANPNEPWTCNPGQCENRPGCQIHSSATKVEVVTDVTIVNNGLGTNVTSPFSVQCDPPLQHITGTVNAVLPGAPLTSADVTAAMGLKWLETSLDWVPEPSGNDLFMSTDPTSPNFLRPIWSHPLVSEFITNKGWEAISIRNSDGKIADIGAIPSNGRRLESVARIKPTNVVAINNNGQASASFFITLEDGGTFNNPRIKFLRWVSLINNPSDTSGGNDFWGSQGGPIVLPSQMTVIPAPTTPLVTRGNNIVNFPVSITGGYGFFEMVLEGEDANGVTISSDVGFLPYRKLDYTLTLELFDGATRITTPEAGQPYTLRVTANSANGPYNQSNLTRLVYTLILGSDAALMYNATNGQCDPNSPLASETDVQTAVSNRMVCFTKAGETVLMGSGYANQAPFLGTTVFNVLPGPPDRIAFTSPIPKADLRGMSPTPIGRGASQLVTVEVQDRFENAVGPGYSVRIEAMNSDLNNPPITGKIIGDAGAPNDVNTKTVVTGEDGIARFHAVVVDGVSGDIFDMVATVNIPGVGEKSDVGSLRVARTLDAISVFYADADAGVYDPDEVINGEVGGPWFLITARAMLGTDVLDRTQPVRVTSEHSLIFAATEGGTPTDIFSMVGGEVTFWVSAETEVTGACVTVTALRAGTTEEDGGIRPGSRCDISFKMPSSDIGNAVIYGDGHGRPDSLVLNYSNDGTGLGFNGPNFPLPDSVAVRWPTATSPPVTVWRNGSGADPVRGNYVLSMGFRSLSSEFTGGYTSIPGQGLGIIVVYGGMLGSTAVNNTIPLLDGIGPVIASSADGRDGFLNPMIVENAGNAADTLIVQLSESIYDEVALEGTGSILYMPGPEAPNNNPATGGTPLNIAFARAPTANNSFKLILAPGSPVPKEGDWIRLNSASDVLDNAASGSHPSNKVHANSRWVQVILKPMPPEIDGGYYTSDVRTGLLDYAYITFNKAVDTSTWFSGGFISFGMGVDAGTNPGRFISRAEGDPNTVRVNLAEAFPSSQNAVRTGGGMPVRIGFTPQFDDWPEMEMVLADSAKPVLADNVTLKFGRGSVGSDTLVVLYSEIMPAGITSIASPIAIIPRAGGNNVLPVMSSGVQTTVGTYTRVTYLVEKGQLVPGEVLTGDSVYIVTTAGVVDEYGNVQDDERNRRVALNIDYNMEWEITVTHNPLKSGGVSDIYIGPTTGPSLNIWATLHIYDNLGNIVRTEKKNVTNLTRLEWQWDGRNDKGRFVGTGTYLLRVNMEYQVVGEEKKMRYRGSRKVGFVR